MSFYRGGQCGGSAACTVDDKGFIPAHLHDGPERVVSSHSSKTCTSARLESSNCPQTWVKGVCACDLHSCLSPIAGTDSPSCDPDSETGWWTDGGAALQMVAYHYKRLPLQWKTHELSISPICNSFPIKRSSRFHSLWRTCLTNPEFLVFDWGLISCIVS